jgi:hypothetical protein
MQIRVVKSRADNPLTSLESAAAIAALTFGYQLIPKDEAKNFEDYVEETKQGTLRETLWVFNDLSTANIAGENVALKDFIARFMDLKWCEAHADSPIANLRHYHENVSLWREHFRANKPMILMRKGQRVLKIRPDASDKEKAKWLKLL